MRELTANWIQDELKRARAKYPFNIHMMVALTEEVGELAQALLEHGSGSERVREEAIQVACVAVRIIEEGDADFTPGNRYPGTLSTAHLREILELAGDDESIPTAAVLLQVVEPDEDAIDWANTVVERLSKT